MRAGGGCLSTALAPGLSGRQAARFGGDRMRRGRALAATAGGEKNLHGGGFGIPFWKRGIWRIPVHM